MRKAMEPLSAQPVMPGEPRVTPWEEARKRLEQADTYWLATTRPDGLPHVRPVLAVWAEGALYFCTGAGSLKGKNLARDPHCAITVENPQLHLVVEGRAVKVRDDAVLRSAAGVYAAKYDWHVEVREHAFYAEGAPTAGPPPYDLYDVVPAMIFGFGTDETFSATCWRFSEPGEERHA